ARSPDISSPSDSAPPYCSYGGAPFDAQDQHLVAFGDRFLGQLVSGITGASFWARGNNAIVITTDEGDDNAGCCDAGNADPNGAGGGKVASIVIASHGPRGIKDPTPYNHFSLLQTIQRSFGLGCLEFTCDVTNVMPLAPLFAITGSTPIATEALTVPNLPLPTPTPPHPSTPPTPQPRRRARAARASRAGLPLARSTPVLEPWPPSRRPPSGRFATSSRTRPAATRTPT